MCVYQELKKAYLLMDVSVAVVVAVAVNAVRP